MAWGNKVTPLFLLTLLMSGFGVLMVYNASSAMAITDFNDKYYFLRDQVKWVIIGITIMLAVSRIPFSFYKKMAFPILLGTIGMLCLVFLPGIGIRAYGASRWVNLGIATLQPSEFAKLALIIYLSAWFENKETGRLGAFLLLVGLLVGLILLQPDMGTAIILCSTAVVMYFISGAPVWHFAALLPLGGIGAGLLAFLSPYRLKRVTSFLDPTSDPLGASYHVRQALISLGSGGIFGVGLGNSRQKYSYLPEAYTDSIFGIIGEETGLLGSAVLLLAFSMFVYLGFKIATSCKERFGSLLAIGITAWLGIQAFINIGAMVAIIPLTGVPMPFISYGGSAIIAEFAAVGILLNIARNK